MLFSRGLFAPVLIPFFLSGGTLANDALERAEEALRTLQDYYNDGTGMWNTIGWWNGANCLTAIADLALVDPSVVETADYVFNNTLNKAPPSNPNPGPEVKTTSKRSVYSRAGGSANVSQWLDSAYDDDAWWALAWIAAYDVTEDNSYLSLAEGIFAALVCILFYLETQCPRANEHIDKGLGNSLWWGRDTMEPFGQLHQCDYE